MCRNRLLPVVVWVRFGVEAQDRIDCQVPHAVEPDAPLAFCQMISPRSWKPTSTRSAAMWWLRGM